MTNIILVLASVINVAIAVLDFLLVSDKVKQDYYQGAHSSRKRSITKAERALLEVLMGAEQGQKEISKIKKGRHNDMNEKAISEALNALIKKGYVEVDYSSDTNGAIYRTTKNVEHIV